MAAGSTVSSVAILGIEEAFWAANAKPEPVINSVNANVFSMRDYLYSIFISKEWRIMSLPLS